MSTSSPSSNTSSESDDENDPEVIAISSAEALAEVSDDQTVSFNSSASAVPTSNSSHSPSPYISLSSPDPEPPLRSRTPSSSSPTASPSPPPVRTPPRVSPPRSPPPARSPPKRPKPQSQDSSDENACSICLEPWTSGGEHHLCCLPCGHLFGYHCIKTWLQSNRRGKCPTCKLPARVRDLRYIFGVSAKLAVADTTELQHARKKLREEKESHECTKVRLKELKKVADRALTEVAELRRRVVNPAPSFGGAPGGSKPSARAEAPSLLANCRTNGGSITVDFDDNANVFYGENVLGRGLVGDAQRIARFDIGRCAVAGYSRVASHKRINALAVSTNTASPSHRCIAIASAERRLKIFAPGMALAGEIECDSVPLSATWLHWKPNYVVMGTLDGKVLTYDTRQLRSGSLYVKQLAPRARAVHSVKEIVVDSEAVVLAGTATTLFGLSFNGLMGTPAVCEIPSPCTTASSICGISVSEGLVAVSSREKSNLAGSVSLHAGLRRLADGRLVLGSVIGEPLQGHKHPLPFGEVGLLGVSGVGEEFVAVGDCNVKGGLRMWRTKTWMGERQWEEYEIGTDCSGGGSQHGGGVRRGGGGGGGETVRAIAAMRLPQKARLGRVPTGTEGLFACVSNANIRLFGAGWYR